MSRIGKNTVVIPEGVSCSFDNAILSVKGKLGEMSLQIPNILNLDILDKGLSFTAKNNNKKTRSMWGTIRSLSQGMVTGVDVGYSKTLLISGVGYRAALKNSNLVLQLGYSHEVIFNIPDGIKITCETPTTIVVFGVNKQKVGQVAAVIRSYRPPEPYKGKGVAYKGEYIRRKEGKKK